MTDDKFPLLAIDPGPTRSGVVLVARDLRVLEAWPETLTSGLTERMLARGGFNRVAVEMLACYGMAVGADVLETAVVIGAMVKTFQSAGFKVHKMYRKSVVSRICGSARAKDPNVSQALRDFYVERFGRGGGSNPAKGTKAEPGPLQGVTSHAMQALALAVALAEDDFQDHLFAPL